MDTNLAALSLRDLLAPHRPEGQSDAALAALLGLTRSGMSDIFAGRYPLAAERVPLAVEALRLPAEVERELFRRALPVVADRLLALGA